MSFLKNFTTVGAVTLASRGLGFVRDTAMAGLLGAGPAADAFFAAFRLPTLLGQIVADGTFNTAFVPLFGRAISEGGREGGERFGRDILAVLLVALAVVTALGEIAMPALMLVIAPGFAGAPEKYILAVELGRIIFPFFASLTLTAMIAGILQAFGRFVIAAFAPVLLNITLVVAMIWLSWTHQPHGGPAARWLAWAILVAGILQLIVVAVGLSGVGIRLRLQRPRMTENVRRLGVLAMPGVASVGIAQIGIVIGTAIASIQPNGVAWINYADRLCSLPLGVIGATMGVVLLPTLTAHMRANDHAEAATALNRALELGLFLTLPAAVILALIPTSLVHVLFERGAFGPGDVVEVSRALAAFANGLPAFVLIKVFAPAYFAREDTKTPLTFAAIGLSLNITAALALFPLIGTSGIAAGVSLGGWVNAGMLGVGLARRRGFRPDTNMQSRVRGIIAASIAMGMALFAADAVLRPDAADKLMVSGPLLLLDLAAAAFVYLGTAHVTGVLGGLRSQLHGRG